MGGENRCNRMVGVTKGPTPEEVEAYAKALGKILRELRDERDLQRRWVAKQLGVHYNTE